MAQFLLLLLNSRKERRVAQNLLPNYCWNLILERRDWCISSLCFILTELDERALDIASIQLKRIMVVNCLAHPSCPTHSRRRKCCLLLVSPRLLSIQHLDDTGEKHVVLEIQTWVAETAGTWCCHTMIYSGGKAEKSLTALVTVEHGPLAECKLNEI